MRTETFSLPSRKITLERRVRSDNVLIIISRLKLTSNEQKKYEFKILDINYTIYYYISYIDMNLKNITWRRL